MVVGSELSVNDKASQNRQAITICSFGATSSGSQTGMSTSRGKTVDRTESSEKNKQVHFGPLGPCWAIRQFRRCLNRTASVYHGVLLDGNVSFSAVYARIDSEFRNTVDCESLGTN